MPDGVQIDTEKVGDVARTMRSDADGGFANAATRGTTLHQHGVEFGARMTPSAAMTEAKTKYAIALANTEANLRAYQAAASILATTAEQISQMFAQSDQNSAEAQQRIQAMFNQAVQQANERLTGVTSKGLVL